MNGSPSSSAYATRNAAELLEPYIPGLRRYAYTLLRGDREGADDLVQDCLERALSRWHQRRSDGELCGWIYTILYHRFVTDWRRRRRDLGSRSLTEILETEQPSVEGGQEGALAQRDLLRGFAELPEEQRSVLLLIGVEDFSYEQTAHILGVPIGTVMSRLSRGRERLSQYMNGDQARARPGPTNHGDTRSDGLGGARLGRNCSAVRRTAATEDVPTIAIDSRS
jgi:RNA polymerase sigma factor (sigma-70 family)